MSNLGEVPAKRAEGVAGSTRTSIFWRSIRRRGFLDWTNASDTDGVPKNLTGDQLSAAERTFMSSKKYLRAFDPARGRYNDSGMTMLRIGSMNLMLHGIESPQFFYMDTLSKSFNDEREYDVILMNPPFKGAVDAKRGDVHP